MWETKKGRVKHCDYFGSVTNVDALITVVRTNHGTHTSPRRLISVDNATMNCNAHQNAGAQILPSLLNTVLKTQDNTTNVFVPFTDLDIIYAQHSSKCTLNTPP